MEQRISLVTLGVANVGRARRFYERLGWKASAIGGDEVAFYPHFGLAPEGSLRLPDAPKPEDY
jgi:catechol 2,3-dioxygenase-like lactoylglutathione lyase family enzyme